MNYQKATPIFGIPGIFRCWNPYAYDDVYLEGKPNVNELREIAERRVSRLTNWTFDEEKQALYQSLRLFKGYRMLFQLWDNLMLMLYDEGPLPFIATITDVSILPVEVEGIQIDQIYIHFETYYLPRMQKENGYYDPVKKHPAIERDGQSFRMNAGSLYIIELPGLFSTDTDIESWRRHLE